jgi:Fe2+ or Zn2+ uptake regulation protein
MKHNRDHVMQIVKDNENIGHAQIKELYEKEHKPISAHALSRALATLVDYQLIDRRLHGNQPCTYSFIGGKSRFSQSPKIAMFDRFLASVGVKA